MTKPYGSRNKSFRTREAGFKGARTLKSRLEQREATIKKQREAFHLAIAENALTWQDALKPRILKSPQGTFECPNCFGDAHWERTGRDCTMQCDCGWDCVAVFNVGCDN